ncbi:MAG: hypothetical protein AAF559_11815 [Pseudomonadota bacterium]
MRAVLIPVLAFALTGASDEAATPAPEPDQQALFEEYRSQLEALKKRDIAAEIAQGAVLQGLKPSNCNDRLERAQDKADEAVVVTPGPLLRRGPNTSDSEPLAIYAVHRREGGCAVMVMMGDPTDVRPLPSLRAEDHRLMPADGGATD